MIPEPVPRDQDSAAPPAARPAPSALIEELDLPIAEQVVATRRDLHRFAETAWCEVRTASKLARMLQAVPGWQVRYGPDVIARDSRLGLPTPAELEQAYRRALDQGADPSIAAAVKDGFTGVTAIRPSGRPGPVVALRFDIDANTGREADDARHLPARAGFASVNAGAHHNCGHDGHAAMGIGLARALAAADATVDGEVRLIFQPAEEGLRGARAMVDAGVLDGVDVLIGCHVGVQAGRPGEIIAGYRNLLASAKLDVLFEGRGAHAAISPHLGRNALLAACTAVLNLHALPRHGEGETRVNVGLIAGGESRNAVPARVRLAAEVRGDTTAILEHLEERARAVIEGSALTQGVVATVERQGNACAASSDADVAELVTRAAGRVAGVIAVREAADFKASDDASVMMDAVQRRGGKAVYIGIGASLADVHHSPWFDFDDRVLPLGVDVLAAIVRLLARG